MKTQICICFHCEFNFLSFFLSFTVSDLERLGFLNVHQYDSFHECLEYHKNTLTLILNDAHDTISFDSLSVILGISVCE